MTEKTIDRLCAVATIILFAAIGVMLAWRG
jgi:hypothetical protein